MSTWISHRYTYVPFPWTSLQPPSPSHPIVTDHWFELPSHTSNSHWLSTLHVVVHTFPCYSAIHPTLSFPPKPRPDVHKSVLYACSQAFLVLMILTVWSQVFCRAASTWEFSGAFLMVGLGFGEEDHRGSESFWSRVCAGHVLWVWVVTVVLTLISWVSVRGLCHEVTFFFSVCAAPSGRKSLFRAHT